MTLSAVSFRAAIGRAALWLAVLAGLPISLAAQQGQLLTGYLREEGTGQPVQGAFVAVLDAEERRVAGALTLPDGRFLIRVPVPGVYRLRPERIGFSSVLSDPVRIDPGQTVRLDLVAPAQAIELGGIEVDGTVRCDLGEAGQATMQLWEEARKALSVARWTEQAERFEYELESWERTLDPRGRQIMAERKRRSTHIGRHAYRAIDPEQLEADGYVAGDLAKGFQYFAPDAEVLLSDSFLRTHCFTAVRDDERFGLRFEPAPGRRVPDVSGTLWMAERSTRLERLNYRYVNLPDLAEAGIEDRSGGEVRFEALPSGEWIVRWWEIRMPVLVRGMGIGAQPRPRLQVAEVRTQGGEVVEVREMQGRTGLTRGRAGPAPGFLRGFVADSTAGAVLEGATVFLSGTSRSTTSSDDGTFVLDELREGSYTLALQHPRLAQLGVPSPTQVVEIRQGRETLTALAIPSISTLVEQACIDAQGDPLEPGTAAVGGVVRTGGLPIDELTVRVDWQRIDQQAGRARVVNGGADIRPDELGRWGVCRIPTGHRVVVQVIYGQLESVPVELGLLDRDETRWVTLEAPTPN